MDQKVNQVVKKHEKTGKLPFFLALFSLIWGAVAVAQKPVVALSVSDKKVAPDAAVTVTVTTNLNGTIKVDYPLEYEVDYALMHGMEQKMDPSTGKIQTFYYMQQAGAFHKQGSYSFYAYVKYKGKTYKSNQVTIKVSDEEEEEDDNAGYNSKDPLFGVIQAEKTSVYEGEPVLLKAKVFSRLDIFMLEGYSPFKADKNAENHIFQNQKYELEHTKCNGKEMLTFEYGKQLLFPIGTGKCKIQPFEMALRCHGSIFDKTVSFRSSSATIIIKPLPDGAPADFIGGVGRFSLEQQLGKQQLKQGDVFTLTLTVEGLGNLHNTNAPILKLPKGCSIYGDPERTENYTYTEDGVEGDITYMYNIQATKSGKIAFAAPSISWFDPVKEEYVTAKTAAFSLDISPNQSFQPIVDNSAAPKVNVEDQTNIQHVPAKKQEASSTAMLVGIITPVCLLGALFLFFGFKKRQTNKAPALSPEIGLSICATPLKSQADLWAETVASKDDTNKFAILLPKAIIQQIENRRRFNCHSREKTLSHLSDSHPEHAKSLRTIIEICDQFRYGFGDVELNTEELLHDAQEILASI